MRAYTTNVLPTDAAYYTLANATINNNQLNILAGGSATIVLTTAQLASLTEFFRVTAVMTPSSDAYEGGIYIIVKIISDSGEYISHFCNVVTNTSGIFSTEIEAIAEDYTSMEVIIKSNIDCIFTSWGLEPEASDGDVQVEIDGVKQSLPRLLYDYNTSLITVGLTEHLVGMISCYLTANTDLQGHFLMNVNAAERCTVYLRFYDNNMEELFSPLLYTINAGLTTITVPHAYLSKLVGIHNFTATAQVTNGSLSIPIRSMLYTIDGGYLAERLLNPGMDTQDITIMQLPTDDAPSYVYAVGIDNNIITVKRHAYSPTKANEAWEAVYTIGTGNVAAIEFDGVFELLKGSEKYTLFTKDSPDVFWLDSAGVLWTQHGSVVSTLRQLATDVVTISTCRGWNSNIFTDRDTGLIVAYTKSDGSVWYRCLIGTATETETWENETQITDAGTGNSYVHVHRLNDYRIGFAVTGINKHYITDRFLIGAGTAPSYVDIIADYRSFAVAMEKTDTELTVVESARTSEYECYITFNFPLYLVSEDAIAPIVVKKVDGTILQLTDFSITDSTLFITAEQLSKYSDIVVQILDMASLQFGIFSADASSGRKFVSATTITIEGEQLKITETIAPNVSLDSFEIDYRGLEYVTHEQDESLVDVSSSFDEFTIGYDALTRITYEDNTHGTAELVSTFDEFTITYNFVGGSPL